MSKKQPNYGNLPHFIIKPQFAFHTILLDVIRPFLDLVENFKYIIEDIEGLKKWIEVCPIKNLDVITIACFLLDLVFVRKADLSL